MTYETSRLSVAAAARRTVRVGGTGYRIFPAGPAAGVTLTASGSADTYGSYSEVAASVASQILLVGVLLYAGGTAGAGQVMIGRGVSGSETGCSEIPVYAITNAGTVTPIWLPLPVEIPAGTRLAAKYASATGGSTIAVKLVYLVQTDVVIS